MVETRPARLADAESFELEHPATGDRYEITVAVLGNPERGPYPTLYACDANGTFATYLQLAGFLRVAGEVSSMVLVGVGYPLDGFFTNPSAMPEWAASREAHSYPAGHPHSPGRVTDLFEFLEDTLVPQIESVYPASGPRRIMGGSATGIFALQAWMTLPHLFDSCAVSAPAIEIQSPTDAYPSMEPHLRSLEPSFLARRSPEAQLFQSYGTLERVVSIEAGRRLHERMTAAGVSSSLMMLDGEIHNTSWAAGASHAMRALFPRQPRG